MGHRPCLTGVDPGEIVGVPNEHDARDPTMVCGRCPSARGYYCLTHHTRLANAHQVHAHVDTTAEPAHWLATWCHAHGRIEALTTSAAEALAEARHG